MSRAHRALAALLAALLTLSLAGCAGSGESGGAAGNLPGGESQTNTQSNSDDFQRNLHQNDQRSGIPRFLEADGGYYFSLGTLYYLDRETMQVTVVCAKPDCDHTDDAVCNARLDVKHLLTLNDRIYYDTTPRSPKQVWSVRQDATERQLVQELKSSEGSSAQSNYDIPIYHRGYLYYISDDILYRVKLGGEKDSAEEIWSPENAGSSQSHGNLVDFNPNAIQYKLWADGDSLYFMANVQTADGTYKDVLFQCGLDGSDVRQVWVTPDKDEVGEWEKTGVSVSQWYVTGGTIYFYLSGGDMWKTELSSGKTEKLADTHEKTQYGTAVFSDAALCLLNDVPKTSADSTEVNLDSALRHYGGDTIFVYNLDGTLTKEIPLYAVQADLGDLYSIDMLCCDGTDVYFDATQWTYRTNEYGWHSGNTGTEILYRANFETGEVYPVIVNPIPGKV